MKIKIIVLAATFLGVLSCSKKSDPEPVPPGNQSFKWTIKSVVYNADSSAANLNVGPIRRNLLAWVGTTASYKIGFELTSFNVGGYELTSAGNPNPPPAENQNNLHYFDDNGEEMEVQNGSINILSNNYGRISGNFTVNLLDAGGGFAYLVGSFTDVPVKQ